MLCHGYVKGASLKKYKTKRYICILMYMPRLCYGYVK